MFVLCRQFALSKNAIAGGLLFCRPKLVNEHIAESFNQIVELHEHLSDVDYGVDEHFIYDFAIKKLHNEKILFVVRDTLRITNCITDAKKEIECVKKVFPHADFIEIRVLEKIKHERAIIEFPKIESLKFLKESQQSTSYILNGKEIVFGKPFRIERSEFCQERLPFLLDKLLS